MFLSAIILSFLLAELRGGRLGNLRQVEFYRWEWLMVGGLLQLGLPVAVSRGWLEVGWHTGLLNVVGYLLLAWGVAPNLKIWGMPILATSLLLNLAVIAANGGRMPVSAAALSRAGLAHLIEPLAAGSVPTHFLMAPGTRLGFLADILYIPRPFWRPCTLSVGDVFIIVGVFLLVQAVTGARRPRRVAGLDERC